MCVACEDHSRQGILCSSVLCVPGRHMYNKDSPTLSPMLVESGCVRATEGQERGCIVADKGANLKLRVC